MTMDKGVKHGKEFRRPYRKSKRFDKSCRNHGSCSRCQGDRLYNRNKRTSEADRDMKDQ